MRLHELLVEDILEEGFQWDYPEANEVSKTFETLIKYNNGLWKSTKQRDFLLGNRSPLNFCNIEDNLSHYNLSAPDGSTAFKADGTAVWAEGPRGRRPVSFVYVTDKNGVFYKAKLGYKEAPGSRGRNMIVDPSKTEIVWKRAAGVALSEPKPTEPTEPTGDFVGEKGQRLALTLTVKKCISLGWGQYGERFLTIAEDTNGNTFFLSTRQEEGAVLNLTATVKDHIISKRNQKVTVLERPRAKK
jgi:hypothetical protein